LFLIFAEVLCDNRGITLVKRVCGVDNVVVQHDIFEIFEESYIFLLTNAINHSLVFSQNIIEYYLLRQNVNYFIIVNTVSTIIDIRVLNEPESFFKGESDPI
jgi:hypothetical protein